MAKQHRTNSTIEAFWFWLEECVMGKDHLERIFEDEKKGFFSSVPSYSLVSLLFPAPYKFISVFVPVCNSL